MAGDRTVDCGFEIEVSQELSRQLKKSSSGLLIPLAAMQRDLVAGTTGANLIGTDYRPQDFIDILRARSLIMQLNPTILNNLVGNVAIPRKTGSATAGWYDLDGTDSIAGSNQTLDQVAMTMKSVGGLVTFTHKMLKQGSPDIETMVRTDLAAVIGREIDRAAIAGTGASNQPTGIVNQSGINASTYTNGGAPTFADIVGMEGLISTADADVSRMAYLTTPPMASGLKLTEKSASTAQFVWDSTNPGEGRMNGFNARYSSNVPTGSVILGNFSDLVIGHWGALEIAADAGGANFAKGSVSVRAIMDMDVAVRHPESFCVMTEAAL